MPFRSVWVRVILCLALLTILVTAVQVGAKFRVSFPKISCDHFAFKVHSSTKDVQHPEDARCAPDGKVATIGYSAESALILDMGSTPIIDEDGIDFYFYENVAEGEYIELDPVEIDLAADDGTGNPASFEQTIPFVWGDTNQANNGNIPPSYYSNGLETPNQRIWLTDLHLNTGIGIDIGRGDGTQYRFVRIRSFPPNTLPPSYQRPQVDAIEALHYDTKPTETPSLEPTSPTVTVTSAPYPVPSIEPTNPPTEVPTGIPGDIPTTTSIITLTITAITSLTPTATGIVTETPTVSTPAPAPNTLTPTETEVPSSTPTPRPPPINTSTPTLTITPRLVPTDTSTPSPIEKPKAPTHTATPGAVLSTNTSTPTSPPSTTSSSEPPTAVLTAVPTKPPVEAATTLQPTATNSPIPTNSEPAVSSTARPTSAATELPVASEPTSSGSTPATANTYTPAIEQKSPTSSVLYQTVEPSSESMATDTKTPLSSATPTATPHGLGSNSTINEIAVNIFAGLITFFLASLLGPHFWRAGFFWSFIIALLIVVGIIICTLLVWNLVVSSDVNAFFWASIAGGPTALTGTIFVHYQRWRQLLWINTTTKQKITNDRRLHPYHTALRAILSFRDNEHKGRFDDFECLKERERSVGQDHLSYYQILFKSLEEKTEERNKARFDKEVHVLRRNITAILRRKRRRSMYRQLIIKWLARSFNWA